GARKMLERPPLGRRAPGRRLCIGLGRHRAFHELAAPSVWQPNGLFRDSDTCTKRNPHRVLTYPDDCAKAPSAGIGPPPVGGTLIDFQDVADVSPTLVSVEGGAKTSPLRIAPEHTRGL